MKISSENRKKQRRITKLLSAGIPLAAMLVPAAAAAEQINSMPVGYMSPPDERAAEYRLPAEKIKSARYHTVQKQDTLTKIAKKYGTTVKILCQLNNFSAEKADKLQIGEKIVLPAENNAIGETRSKTPTIRGKIKVK